MTTSDLLSEVDGLLDSLDDHVTHDDIHAALTRLRAQIVVLDAEVKLADVARAQVLREHAPVPFQGKTYCAKCRAPFWPREAIPEALWPCPPARACGVTE